jgi:hypothetical protein
VKLVEDQPFPHTLPTTSTAWYNTKGNHTGAGYDGPGECLKHVFGAFSGTPNQHTDLGDLYEPVSLLCVPGGNQSSIGMGEPLEWAAENASLVEASWIRINNSEYITANNYAQGYTSPGRVCY